MFALRDLKQPLIGTAARFMNATGDAIYYHDSNKGKTEIEIFRGDIKWTDKGYKWTFSELCKLPPLICTRFLDDELFICRSGTFTVDIHEPINGSTRIIRRLDISPEYSGPAIVGYRKYVMSIRNENGLLTVYSINYSDLSTDRGTFRIPACNPTEILNRWIGWRGLLCCMLQGTILMLRVETLHLKIVRTNLDPNSSHVLFGVNDEGDLYVTQSVNLGTTFYTTIWKCYRELDMSDSQEKETRIPERSQPTLFERRVTPPPSPEQPDGNPTAQSTENNDEREVEERQKEEKGTQTDGELIDMEREEEAREKERVKRRFHEEIQWLQEHMNTCQRAQSPPRDEEIATLRIQLNEARTKYHKILMSLATSANSGGY